MSNNVFMKNVRDLRYREMYENDKLRNRVVANLIYELPKRGRGTPDDDKSKVQPSAEMIRISQFAASTPTTLWFEDAYQLDAIVLCGRVTACYNLIEHVQKRLKEDVAEPNNANDTSSVPELEALRSRLFVIWQSLEEEVSQFPIESLGAADSRQWLQ
ncbi:MAG: hypothetical protein O3C40_26710 [Planctomycetota bacterium]|nr:hypothetical protein [Planctomycetota bacterium]